MAEKTASDAYREMLEEQAPSPQEQHDLLWQHEGHQIRHTTSKLSETHELAGGKMEMKQEAEVPDTYCFTCEEWVGTSGVELSGTPRSKSDAFYLGGEPEGVTDARDRATAAVADAATEVIAVHPGIETPTEAVGFVVDAAKNAKFVGGDDAE